MMRKTDGVQDPEAHDPAEKEPDSQGTDAYNPGTARDADTRDLSVQGTDDKSDSGDSDDPVEADAPDEIDDLDETRDADTRDLSVQGTDDKSDPGDSDDPVEAGAPDEIDDLDETRDADTRDGTDNPDGTREPYPQGPGRFPCSRMVAMVGGWALFFCIYNTNNPLTQLITMDPASFAWEAGVVDYAIYIGGHILALLIVAGFLCIGMGYKRARRLLVHRPQRPLVPTFIFLVVLVIACLVDNILAYRLPGRFLLDLPVVLEDLSYDAFRIAVATGVVGLVQSFTRQIIVMTPLALVVDSEMFCHVGMLKWAVVGLWLYLLGGLLSASPTQGSIVYCIVSNGCAELTYGWHFCRCRNLVLTVVAGWVVQALVGYVLFSLV